MEIKKGDYVKLIKWRNNFTICKEYKIESVGKLKLWIYNDNNRLSIIDLRFFNKYFEIIEKKEEMKKNTKELKPHIEFRLPYSSKIVNEPIKIIKDNGLFVVVETEKGEEKILKEQIKYI